MALRLHCLSSGQEDSAVSPGAVVLWMLLTTALWKNSDGKDLKAPFAPALQTGEDSNTFAASGVLQNTVLLVILDLFILSVESEYYCSFLLLLFGSSTKKICI